jgi:hypothetical protein
MGTGPNTDAYPDSYCSSFVLEVGHMGYFFLQSFKVDLLLGYNNQ